MNFTNTGHLDLTERRPRSRNSIQLTNPNLCPQNYNPKSVEQERYNNRGHLDSLYALGNQNEEGKTHVEEQNEEKKTHVNEKIEEKAKKTNEWEIFFGAKGGWVVMQTNKEDVNISPVCEKEEEPRFKIGGFFQEQANPFRPLDVFNPEMKQGAAKTGDSNGIYGSDGALQTESDINSSPVCDKMEQPRFKTGGFQEQTNPHRPRDVFNPDAKQRKAKTGNFGNGLQDNEFLERNSSSDSSGIFVTTGRLPMNLKPQQEQTKKAENNADRREYSDDVRLDKSHRFEHRGSVVRPSGVLRNITNRNNNRLGTVRQGGNEPQNVAAKPNRRPPTGARSSGKKKDRRPNAHRPSTSVALGHGVHRGVTFTGNGDAQPFNYISAVLQNDRLRRFIHRRTPALYDELVGYVYDAFVEKLNLNK